MTSPQLPLAVGLRPERGFGDFVWQQSIDLLPFLKNLAAGRETQGYVHGLPGTGKSHLLEATVDAAEQQGRRACLLSANMLIDLPPEALDGMEHFDLVAIDDIDKLADQPAWQEAIFHLYNRVRLNSGSLLFSASAAPQQSGITLKDLQSRLGAGAVFALTPLDDAGLTQFLYQQAASRGLSLGDELARYLVMRAPRQPAALAAIMQQLDQASLADQRRLTIPFVRQQLGW